MSGRAAELVIRRLTPADWSLFRQIRMRGLAEAPRAFGSTLAEAVALDEPAWRERLAGRAQFVAMLGPEAVGTAGGFTGQSGAELIAMWVDPRVRGAGVGDRLVAAVLNWARDEGYRAIGLWVTEGNKAAERLYERNGFRRTGDCQTVDERHPGRCEFAMRRALHPGA